VIDARHRQAGIAVAVLLGAALMPQLDLFIVNVAIPDLHRAFPGSDLSALSWTLTAYTIVFAAVLMPVGRLADQLGRRETLLLGVTLFTAASLACGLAPTVATLVAARAIQATGAAMVMPVSLAMLLGLFPDRHSLLVGVWAGMGGTAAALGPSLGGLLLQAGWRWIFLINVPIGMAALLAGRVALRREGGNGGVRPDFVGAMALAGSVGLLVLAIVQGSSWGWGSERWIASLVGSLALGGVFFWQNRRHQAPTVDWSLLHVRDYAAANVAAAFFYVSLSCMVLEYFLFMQQEWASPHCRQAWPSRPAASCQQSARSATPAGPSASVVASWRS
jgi:MFS family permease